MTDLSSRSLPAVAQALRDRTFTAREVVEEAIAGHERGEALNAYLLWTPARARKAAEAADAAFTADLVA
ncbi:MAG: Asp-tRNA(Asn)/Glu-tRNA(Gln) amidotransferase subunit GatA, partial [Stellaceae bacterium]